MRRAESTEALIGRLAEEAGAARRGGLSFPRVLTAGLALALPAAFAVVLLLVGPRPDLAAVAGSRAFLFKLGAMGLLALGGIRLVHAAGLPGQAARPWPSLLPGVLFLLVGVALDRSGFPLMGRHPWSVPVCLGAILAASLPPLAILLGAIGRGIPTRPALAGAVAGGLAGALGAFAYVIACVNDGAAFVAVWYALAIALMTGLGAALGRRLLAW